MQNLDYLIVALYFVALVSVGVSLAWRAGRGSEHYFLGNHRIPWWALGSSGMASNLDAAGTMLIISLIYTFGLHGFFIEMRGGVVLPIAVFLAFMGKWHQRSRVMTTAEWMELRFGPGGDGHASRIVAALTYLVITVGMVVFFLSAAGKFLAVFLPFEPETCAVLMALLALAYTMLSGLYGVVWTDVFQAFLIGAAAIYVSFVGWQLVSPELLAAWPGAEFNRVIPVFQDSRLDTYELFGLFLIAWFAKGVLEGLGGSGGSAYMAQRYYAAPDEAACTKLAMLWTMLFAFRWPMVLGFALIAIHLGIGQDDPERILPLVLNSEFFPAGLRGLVVAAIFAASMSTFDSTINAGASYLVKDVFQPLRPRSSERELVIAGYVASILIVATGLVLALAAGANVLDVWVIIVIQLFPAFLIPFALRWFWSRFNGGGFVGGVGLGFAAAFSLTLFGGGLELNEVQALSLIASCSLVGSLAGTYLRPAVPEPVLKAFFDLTRPMGLWPRAWKAPHTAEHRRDTVRLGVALVWQLSTFLLPMTLVLRMYGSFAAVAVIWAGLTYYLLRDLKFTREIAAEAERRGQATVVRGL